MFIDPLDARGDRPLDDSLGVVIDLVGVADPEILPAFLVDPGDLAKDKVVYIWADGKTEGDLPALDSTPCRTRHRPLRGRDASHRALCQGPVAADACHRLDETGHTRSLARPRIATRVS